MAASFEPVRQLANKYTEETVQTYDALRRRSVELQGTVQAQVQQVQKTIEELQPQLNAKKDELVQALQNVDGTIEAGKEAPKIMETFAWIAVLQFASFVVAIFSGVLFAPLLGLVFDTFTAMLLAYALVPYAAYLHLRAQEKTDSDDTLRFKLLGFAGVEGALVGYLLSERYLSSMQPLAFLTPLMIAVMAQMAVEKFGGARRNVYALTLGGGLGLQLVLGTILGQMSFAYLLLAALYTGVGFATLQLFFKYMAGDYTQASHVYMLGYFVAAMYAQGLIFLLLGGDKEAYQASKEAAAAAAAQSK